MMNPARYLNSFKSTQAYLYSLQARGMKLGLTNIRVLLGHVGNPHRMFRSVHVAGTNGKGSTSSFIASILMESGLKTGLYTSPHLIRFSERIRINGTEIPEKRIVAYVQELVPSFEETQATFFEATTCIAFRYFADEGVDVAVIETGLGGRLDSTNVLRPLVSVITKISFDHLDVLGRTITSISREKGGIVKRRVPCITSSTDPVVLRTLDRIAARRATKVHRARSIVRILPGTPGDSGRIRLKVRKWTSRRIRLGLTGFHQLENASLAASSCEILRRADHLLLARIKHRCIERGLARVTVNTGLRGRMERVRYQGVPVVLDVAHNPDGVKALTESLNEPGPSKFVVLFGVMRDKDAVGMLASLAGVAAHFVSVCPATDRALPARAIAALMRTFPVPVTVGGSVRRGFRCALKLAGSTNRLLVIGSHYVVGEVLAVMEKDQALSPVASQ